ncbi:TadE/TadG family type IV pilus assembly protein [Neobacillus vireti]|uniref:TadE/TadG family type IV pilus assembly protein n=1 Tax=Neobacillus vireti TaxID=220686 RepID=UPI0030001223
MVTGSRKLLKQEEGQSMVEFAMIVPIFLLMVAGMINIGIILFHYLNLNMTAQEASRLAGLGKTDTEISTYVKDHTTLTKFDKMSVTVSPTVRKSGDYVTVTLSYPIAEITPIFDKLLSPYQLKAASTVRVE